MNRIARETGGGFVLDGVVQVIDVENWAGYADTSYTAKLQARYTDLIVLNKHELAGPAREDEVVDRIRDLSDDTPVVRSDKGWISKDVVFGIDGGLARSLIVSGPDPHHDHEHSSEVDVLSVRLPGREDGEGYVDTNALHQLLTTAPGDEVYRIKGIVRCRLPPPTHPDTPSAPEPVTPPAGNRWLLNWAFGRWTFTPLRESSVSTVIEAPESGIKTVSDTDTDEEYLRVSKQSLGRKGSIEVVVTTSVQRTIEEPGRGTGGSEEAARISVILGRGEGARWTTRLQDSGWVVYDRPEWAAKPTVTAL